MALDGVKHDVVIARDTATSTANSQSSLTKAIYKALRRVHGPQPDDLDKKHVHENPLTTAGFLPLSKSLFQSLHHLGPSSIATLLEAEEAATFKDYVDDRHYVMEHSIQAMTKDVHGLVGKRFTDAFIPTLWNDLPHPPATFLAGESRFRSADGSGNSILHPELGAAGQPYARTVKPASTQPIVQPDPGVLFDLLMQRRTPTEHPAQISSVLFYFATIIIHDLFRTDHHDFAYSKTSSYLDLSPLYGSNETEQAAMRTFKDGKLHPDCFSETRLLVLPPGSGILLIMFNRFHNHVAEQLVAINERGRFTKPSTDAKEAWTAYDEEVFQTARLITCGLYVNVALLDYVRSILNLNRADTDWELDPRLDIPDGPEMGIGNQVSAEFNLVYRWHSTLSVKDEKWTEDKFAEIFGKDRKPQDVPMPEFLGALGKLEAQLESQAPADRKFAHFTKDENGFYDDDQLVESITASIGDCANAFGPRQIPAVLKAVEVLGIKQARSWNLATLNEFRKHFKLRPHETWEDISTDKEVAGHLKDLYKDVNNVELYPGLVVEDAKVPIVPGLGLCPSFTISRAVLSDAVGLVRGDRFFTKSYHPRILTNWGYAEANHDNNVDIGCVMYKLFQRAFPRHFDPDSIYAHYPMTVPDAFKIELKGPLIQRADLYETNAVNIQGNPSTLVVSSYDQYRQVEVNIDSYALDISLVARMFYQLKTGSTLTIGSFLAKGCLCDKISIPNTLLSDLEDGVEGDLLKYLVDKGYTLGTFNEVDIVKEVIGKTAVRLATKLFGIPSSGGGSSAKRCTDDELHNLFNVMASTWSNYDRVYLTAQRQKVHPLAQKLYKSMSSGSTALHVSSFSELQANIQSSMTNAGLSKEQIRVASIALASTFATTLTQNLSEALDYLLTATGASHLSALRTSPSAEQTDEIYRISARPNTLMIGPSGPVLLSAPLLAKDSTAPLPASFILLKDDTWQTMIRTAVATGLKTLVQLPGLRPAATSDGPDKLRRIPVGTDGAQIAYLDEKFELAAWPCSLKVNWDLE